MSSRSSSIERGRRSAARWLVVAIAIAGAGSAHADRGAYFTESFGVGFASGALGEAIGTPLHLRLAVGMRLGNLALEPWILSELQTDRDGAFGKIVGGDPKPGEGDLHAMGLDARYIVDLHKNASVFVRGGPLVGEGTGALDGYHGRGVGVAAGAQLTGKVRALGFLWSPLFFVKRGPIVTGALVVDAGYDFYFLRHANGPPIDARIGHVSVGFALGSAF